MDQELLHAVILQRGGTPMHLELLHAVIVKAELSAWDSEHHPWLTPEQLDAVERELRRLERQLHLAKIAARHLTEVNRELREQLGEEVTEEVPTQIALELAGQQRMELELEAAPTWRSQ